MPARRSEVDEAVLGRTLVETMRLNAPEHVAGRHAAAAVAAVGSDTSGRVRNRRRFRFAMAGMLLGLALLAVALWLAESMA